RAFQRYFPVGELGPSSVLIHHPSLDFTTPRGNEAIGALSRELAALHNVVEVRSRSRPLGKADTKVSQPGILATLGLDRLYQAKVDEHYVSTRATKPEDRNHITRIDIVFGSGPFSTQSLETLERVSQ